MEYQTVLMASLFRNIGRLLLIDWKQDKDCELLTKFIDSYEEFFSGVCNFELFRELVTNYKRGDFSVESQGGKEPSRRTLLAYLIAKANYYSSLAFGVDKSCSDRCLVNCFAQLKLDKPLPDPQGYQPAVLELDRIFSQELTAIDANRRAGHMQSFRMEFKELAGSLTNKPFDVVFSHLDALLHRYAWCIPSCSHEELPDISLYDHIRATCAIAACLYRYHEESSLQMGSINDDRVPKFRLVTGDLSGIQRYIFSISNTGVSGVGKRLRARSFLLTAATEAICLHVLNHFNIPLGNIIVSSGGRFHILAPNTDNADKWIEQFQRELDEWSLERFGGEIRFILAQKAFPGGGFSNFASVLEQIGTRLAQQKARPFSSILVGPEGWVIERFFRGPADQVTRYCPVCGRNAIEDAVSETDASECSACRSDYQLGSRLVRARYLVYRKGSSGQGEFPLFSDYSLDVLSNLADLKSSHLILKINDSDLSEVCDNCAGFKYMGTYIPLAEKGVCEQCTQKCDELPPSYGEPLYFDCLAAKARGRKALGYLKADVDNLGTLLFVGLQSKKRGQVSVSRLATVSRMLDLFFSGYVNELISSRYSNCYTVFSGGDDLFIIGPWDEIVNLALKISTEFTRFTNHNANITLSAGIAFAKPRVPLNRCAAVVENLLERAKNDAARGSEKGRNQIALFGDILKWSSFEELLRVGEKLAAWHGQGIVSTGFLQQSKTFGEMYQAYLDDGRVENLQFIPLMTYQIARTLPEVNHSDPEKAGLRQWAEGLKSKLGPNEETAHLPFIIDYVLMSKE